MDIATILGLVIALIAIVGGNILEGGHTSSLIQPTAALIVVGGTVGATFVSFPLGDLIKALKDMKKAILPPKEDMDQIITDLASYGNMARHNGLLALQPMVQEASNDPFKAKALQLIVDGTDPQQFNTFMEIELASFEASEKVGVEVFEAAGGFAPTIGIIGAVLGLIHVMQNLSDPSKLGTGIAVAFVATIYGLVLANIICLPCSSKLKKRLKTQMLIKTLIIEGLLDIQSGMNPRLMTMKLQGFLPPDKKKSASES